MRNSILIICSLIFVFTKNITAQTNTFPDSGSAGIGTLAPHASSILEMNSTSQGMLIPRMTKAQRNAIVSPATGLLIFQVNSSPGFYYYDGVAWSAMSSTGGANKTLSNLNPTAINQALFPNADNTLDLGSSANSWNDVYADGNSFLNTVSLGTTSTESILNISGTGKVVTIDGTTPHISMENGGFDVGFLQADGNDLTLATYLTNDTGRVVLRANGADRLFVHPSGEVTINTGTPYNNFELGINGDLYVHSQIGLGTTAVNPTAELTISGTDNVVVIDGTNPYIQMMQSGSDIGYLRANDDDLRISTNAENSTGKLLLGAQSTDEMVIHPSGEITINTSTPYSGFELGINGDLYVSSQLGIGTTAVTSTAEATISGTEDVLVIDGTDPYITLRDGGENLGYMQALGEDLRIGIHAANTDGKLIFASNTTTRMYIDHSGNIVMGGATVTPKSGYKLSVDGRVVCEELRVEMYPWADYVFDENYRLMSLNALEEFITQNNHLPNVPSAEEIKENGLHVGEMQATMMEKIEELTLYILELKKMNDELASRLSELESK